MHQELSRIEVMQTKITLVMDVSVLEYQADIRVGQWCNVDEKRKATSVLVEKGYNDMSTKADSTVEAEEVKVTLKF